MFEEPAATHLSCCCLCWSHHISIGVKKANSRLGFLRGCPQQLKCMAYITLVQSLLEFSATIWDPHLAKVKGVLEAVQRRAARWIPGVDPGQLFLEV